jgi:hypothetical protein
MTTKTMAKKSRNDCCSRAKQFIKKQGKKRKSRKEVFPEPGRLSGGTENSERI